MGGMDHDRYDEKTKDECGQLFSLKKWWYIEWTVMHGRVRALEGREAGWWMLLNRSGENNFSNSSIAFAKAYSTEHMIKY